MLASTYILYSHTCIQLSSMLSYRRSPEDIRKVEVRFIAGMLFPANSWALSQDGTMALMYHRLVIEAIDLPIMSLTPAR